MGVGVAFLMSVSVPGQSLACAIKFRGSHLHWTLRRRTTYATPPPQSGVDAMLRLAYPTCDSQATRRNLFNTRNHDFLVVRLPGSLVLMRFDGVPSMLIVEKALFRFKELSRKTAVVSDGCTRFGQYLLFEYYGRTTLPRLYGIRVL